MVNNISDIISYIIGNLKKLLPDELSEYELKMVSDSLELPYRPVSNSKVLISDRIDEAIKSKSDLNYIIIKLKNKRKLISIPYNSEYNKLFTILTRQNRPSKQAIDSEIKYTKPDMSEKSDLINDYDEIIEFFENHKSLIDMLIRNYENRRYEL